MKTFTSWVWDEARKLQYYHNPDDDTYVYQDGTVIAVSRPAQNDTQTQPAPSTAATGNHERNLSHGSSDYTASVVSSMSTMSIGADPGPIPGGGSVPYPQYDSSRPQFPQPSNYQQPFGNQSQFTQYGGQPPYGGFQGYQGTGAYAQTGAQSGYPTSFQSHQHGQANTSYSQGPTDEQKLQMVGRNVQVEPGETYLPQELQNKGLEHRMMLRGTHGDREVLDSNFYVRRPGYEYFKVGVVFRVLWPELAGDAGNMTVPSTSKFKGEAVYCKVRWFVVVREGHNCCTCLPIQTYNRRGVTGTKVKSQHAIVYTGDTAPNPLPSEMPSNAGERPMGDPIRVIGTIPWDNKMDQMSRINFLKVYTIEHNVKVGDFGYVDGADEWKLTAQWNLHWGREGSDRLPAADRWAYSGAHSGPAHAAPPAAAQDTTATAPVASGEAYNAAQSGSGTDWQSSQSMPPIREDATSGHQQSYQTPSVTYSEPGPATYGSAPPANDPRYYSNARPKHRGHRSSGSGWSQSGGHRGQYYG